MFFSIVVFHWTIFQLASASLVLIFQTTPNVNVREQMALMTDCKPYEWSERNHQPIGFQYSFETFRVDVDEIRESLT